MALTTEQQLLELLSHAKRLLITFSPTKGGDAIGSSLALAKFLTKQGKQVDVIASHWQIPPGFNFLPEIEKIKSELASLRKFIVSLNLDNTKLKELSYSVENNKLNIYLTPKNGSFAASDLTTRSSDFIYDAIFVLDSPDLESLGDLYHNNTDFFYQTTIINIDHNITNEHFGQINLVDFNVAATSELIFKLLQSLHPQDIDADIATCLYAALSSATKSFKTINITPDTLSKAAELIALGARREEVVTYLYRTKTLPMLRLWGRALARIKSDHTRKLVWLLLQPEDFIKSGAQESELSGVIDEVVTTAPEAGVIVLIYEPRPGETKILTQTNPGRNAFDLLKPFGPQGDRTIASAILINTTLLEAEKKIIDHLRQILPQSLS